MASTSTASAQATGNNQCGKKEMKNERNVRGVGANTSRPKKVLPPHWSVQEDAILLEYVSVHGPWDWKLISKQIIGRSADGCRNRWWEQLYRATTTNPAIKQQALSKMNNRMRHGKKFGKLPKQLPEHIAACFNAFKTGRRRRNRRTSTFLRPEAAVFRRQLSSAAPHPPPSPPPPPPPPSQSSQQLPPPTFIDFLGVGSV